MIIKRYPTSIIEHFFIDIDGVLLKESGVAEMAYKVILDEIFVEKNYSLNDVRALVKGMSISKKITTIKENYNLIVNKTNRELEDKWIENLKNIIVEKYSCNPKSYQIEGVDNCLNILSKKYHLHAFTTNERNHAQWLLKFTSLLPYFSTINGHSKYSDQTKADLLNDSLNLFPKPIDYGSVCVVGDSKSDITAGKNFNCYCIGIAEDSNKKNLFLSLECEIITENISNILPVFS